MNVDHQSAPIEVAGGTLADTSLDAQPRVFDSRLLESPVGVMRVRTPLLFRQSDLVSQVMSEMRRRHRRSVLITEDGTRRTRLIGIFTDKDILTRVLGHPDGSESLMIGAAMTPEPETLPLDATVAWVLNKIAVGGFQHVPIVDSMGRPKFVVTGRDAIQFLVEAFPIEVLNLPPEFGMGSYREREGA